MTVLSVPSLLSPSVCDELQEVDLITTDERSRLVYPHDVVRVQSRKSPEVLTKTAVVLRRHRLPSTASLLTSKQTLPPIHCPTVCPPIHCPTLCPPHPLPYCVSLIHVPVVWSLVVRATWRHPSLFCLSRTHCWVIVRVYQNHTAFPLGHLKHLLAHTKLGHYCGWFSVGMEGVGELVWNIGCVIMWKSSIAHVKPHCSHIGCNSHAYCVFHKFRQDGEYRVPLRKKLFVVEFKTTREVFQTITLCSTREWQSWHMLTPGLTC